MKTISLNRGDRVAIVDDEDFERVRRHRWLLRLTRGKTEGASTYAKPARVFDVNGRKFEVPMAHEVLGRPPKGYVIDHINGDPFDNRRCNLRVCTQGQNCRNKKRPSRSQFPYRGVYRANSKFAAKITVDFKGIYLGVFPSIEEAARAYDRAAMEYHGDFASLNFPEEAKARGGNIRGGGVGAKAAHALTRTDEAIARRHGGASNS